jgi:hypothetical protein
VIQLEDQISAQDDSDRRIHVNPLVTSQGAGRDEALSNDRLNTNGSRSVPERHVLGPELVRPHGTDNGQGHGRTYTDGLKLLVTPVDPVLTSPFTPEALALHDNVSIDTNRDVTRILGAVSQLDCGESVGHHMDERASMIALRGRRDSWGSDVSRFSWAPVPMLYPGVEGASYFVGSHHRSKPSSTTKRPVSTRSVA